MILNLKVCAWHDCWTSLGNLWKANSCNFPAPEISRFNIQDKFDHDKGQKSAISGRRLHWRLSTGFFAFSPVLMCKLVRRATQNLEKVAKNPVEKIASNPVPSVAVVVFSALKYVFVRDAGTTTKYSNWYLPAEKSLDFPPWGLLKFSGNPVVCAVKCGVLHPSNGEKYRRILWRSFCVAVTGSPSFQYLYKFDHRFSRFFRQTLAVFKKFRQKKFVRIFRSL